MHLTSNMKSIIFTVLFLICLEQTAALYKIQSNFYREETCAAQNGYCLLESECTGSLTEDLRKLCPAQKSQGAVCCVRAKRDVLNCLQLHNTCQEQCPLHLTEPDKGCPEGLVCCVLV